MPYHLLQRLLILDPGCLRPYVTLHSRIHLHGLESPSRKLTLTPTLLPSANNLPTAKAPLPHHYRSNHHLCHPLLLRHGDRWRNLLRTLCSHGIPQARHPRHSGAHLPPSLLGPLHRLGSHHPSYPPRSLLPRRPPRSRHLRRHRRGRHHGSKWPLRNLRSR